LARHLQLAGIRGAVEPLIITQGQPGSVVGFLEVGPLSDPREYGEDQKKTTDPMCDYASTPSGIAW
jgi:hypothetical protein